MYTSANIANLQNFVQEAIYLYFKKNKKMNDKRRWMNKLNSGVAI